MMNEKTLGWIELIGGILAISFSGGGGSYGMMGYGYGMMSGGNTLSITLISLMFVISGIWRITKKR